jgi:hypothetical protein
MAHIGTACPFTAVPMVRISFPPAGRLQTFGPSRVVAIAQMGIADQLGLAQARRRADLLGRRLQVAATNPADPGDEVGRIVTERAATVAVSVKQGTPNSPKKLSISLSGNP